MEEFFLDTELYTLDDDQWLLSPLTFPQPGDQMEDLDFFDDDDDDDDDEQWPLVDARNEPRLRSLSTSSSSSSFNLLNNKKRKDNPTTMISSREVLEDPRPPSKCESLSTEDVMRLAGMRMLQLSSSIDISIDPSLSGLSEEEVRNVELAEYLLSAADKIRNRHFDRASGLLGLCDSLAPGNGNPVERVVHCFTKALRTKIAKETDTVYDMTSNKEFVIDETQLISDTTFLTFHQTVPFHQVQHIAATQAILDNVERAKKIHVIDLKIRNGLEWITLMQALESRRECPVEHLKITALVMGNGTSVQSTESTGHQLSSFAEAFNIPFSFHTVRISELKEFRAGLFQTEPDPEEAVVVFSEFFLNKYTSQPVQMDRVMREIKRLNPRVMVMIETEANHNSPCFSTQFVETLFHYSAFFDCLAACMAENEPDRRVMESVIVTELVTNMLVAEGEERGMRSVKLDVWRSFFARFGMVEKELSDVLLYQVQLVTGKCPGWKFCTTNWDEGSLTIGWKGTPMTSVSVWKFVRTARLVSGLKDLVVEFV